MRCASKARACDASRDINPIDERLAMSRVEITDAQIAYLGNNTRSILLNKALEDMRAVLQETVVRGNSTRTISLALNYIPPISFVNNIVPPRRFELRS